MSVRLMTSVWGLDLKPTEKLVLLALADWSNDDGDCWPSIAQLVAKTGVTERTVQRAIRQAETDGLITRIEVTGKGNRYRLHPRQDDTPATKSPPSEKTQTPATVTPNTLVTTNTHILAREGYRPLPDDWQPSLSETAQAKADQWPPGVLDSLADRFRAWAFNAEPKKGKGLKKDWDRAFNTQWVTEEHDRQKRNRSRDHDSRTSYAFQCNSAAGGTF